MAVLYSSIAINARLNGVVTAIGAAGQLRLQSSGVTVSTIPLANPCGVVAATILTFTVPVADVGAAGTGNVNGAVITDNAGNLMISGLTTGLPLSGADIIVSNGYGSLLITAGQTVTMLSGQIQGS